MEFTRSESDKQHYHFALWEMEDPLFLELILHQTLKSGCLGLCSPDYDHSFCSRVEVHTKTISKYLSNILHILLVHCNFYTMQIIA